MNRLLLGIYGHTHTSAAVLDELVSRNLFSVVKIPDIGTCVRAGTRPELWRPTMASWLSVHPSDVAFTGGTSGDVNWLRQLGTIIWEISDSGVVYVSVKGSLEEDYVSAPSQRGIRAQVNFALGVSREMATGTSVAPVARRLTGS